MDLVSDPSFPGRMIHAPGDVEAPTERPLQRSDSSSGWATSWKAGDWMAGWLVQASPECGCKSTLGLGLVQFL